MFALLSYKHSKHGKLAGFIELTNMIHVCYCINI